LKDLEIGTLEYVMIKEFLIDLKKKFSKRDDEIMKIVELNKKVKQWRSLCKISGGQ